MAHSARRVWRVQVPSSHIEAAKQGFVQTIYQPYATGSDLVIRVNGRLKRMGDLCSWVLSFSSVPF